MNTLEFILTILITAIIVFALCQYRFEVSRKVEMEHPRRIAWEDFVEVNINSCQTTAECEVCRKLIVLFDLKFRGKIPAHVFNDHIERFWNRLDTRYKLLESKEEGLGDVDEYLEKYMS